MKRIIITSVAAIGLAWSGAAFAQTQTPQYNSGGASAPVGQQYNSGGASAPVGQQYNSGGASAPQQKQ